MRNVIHKNIFFNLKKKLSSFKVIKLYKWVLKFFPVLYLNQKDFFSNQINNVKKIIYIWIIASSAAFAIPLGCLLTSFLMRRGRKSTLLMISAVSLVGWLTIYISASFEQIIIGRVLSGIATGLAAVPATVYAAEVSSSKWRSTVVTWTSIAIAFGVLVVYIFGFIFPVQHCFLVSFSVLIITVPKLHYYL